MSRIREILIISLAALTFFTVLTIGAYAAASSAPPKNTEMSVKTGSYCYTTTSATAPYRSSYLTFGEEVRVLAVSGDWAKISVDGKTRYMKLMNLTYKNVTVVKNRVIVSAKASSGSSSLGYAFYGDVLSDLGTVTASGGKIFRRCRLDAVYDANGNIKAKNVEGYINNSYVSETSTPVVFNGGTNLYNYGYGTSSESYKKTVVEKVKTGEHAECLQKNASWAKIRYNGEIRFVSVNKIDPLKLRTVVRRVLQTRDAKPGSGAVHYLYWNTEITVLNTYESPVYGIYYYCMIDGDYGFVRDHSTDGLKYVGSNNTMYTAASTSVYKKADTASGTVCRLTADTAVTAGYSNGTWTEVTVGNKTGFMLADKLKNKKTYANTDYYTSAYKLYRNTSGGQYNGDVTILASNGLYDYAFVRTDTGKTRYMKLSELGKEQNKVRMYTAKPFTTLHTSASSASSFIQIPYMDEVDYISSASISASGAWLKVSYKNMIYYIWQDNGDELLKGKKSSFEYSSTNKIRQEIIDTAMSVYALPTKYVHKQSTGKPDTDGKYGFDCSGFASYVLDTVMTKYVPTYNLSADIDTLYYTDSIYNKGFAHEFRASTVSRDNIQPGDILFFDLKDESDDISDTRPYNHCGIYLGSNEFIHCTFSFGGGVRIMPLIEKYSDSLIRIRRYVPERAVPAEQTVGLLSRKTNVYPKKVSGGTPDASLGLSDTVTVLYTDNNNWAYVRYNGNRTGYVLTKYLSR